MSHVVPLIRAAALMPLLNWLQANGRPIEARLRAVDLAAVPFGDPMRPIPLLSVAAFLRETGRLEGPDIGCRVVSQTSVLELALLGKVALGTRTPAEALARISAALPFFCTHEHLTLHPEPGRITVREFFALKFDPETLHLIHQYAAAMIDVICGITEARPPRLARIEIAPHPGFGLDHLRRWFGDGLVQTKLRTLSVSIDTNIVERRFPVIARDRMAGRRSPDMIPLRGDGSFAGSARIIVASMLENGPPSIERLSAVAGTSVRTLQRRLDAEGTSFSALLDDVRRAEALRRLAAGGTSLGSLSAELGYAQQSALTRAVRRWTGRPPSRRSRLP
jgi:AraC-like DNA-binding protein